MSRALNEDTDLQRLRPSPFFAGLEYTLGIVQELIRLTRFPEIIGMHLSSMLGYDESIIW